MTRNASPGKENQFPGEDSEFSFIPPELEVRA